MKTSLIAIALIAASMSGAAQAQALRISDADYIALAACVGLAEGSDVDASRFEQALQDQRRGRADHIRDRARDARRSAETSARANPQAVAADLAACG